MRFGRSFLLLTAVLVCLNRAGAEAVFESQDKKTDLLELYTSEGCSSCPPAEAWLGNLRDTSGLWTKFVPIAFHVDYWNNLGWQDRFSSPKFTARQRAYADSWGSGNIYTPEFVLNGAEWRRQRGFPTHSGNIPGRLRVSLSDSGHVDVSFQPTAGLKGPFKVAIVPLAMGVTTHVERGENSGMTLRHDFLALGLVEAELKLAEDGAFRGLLALPHHQEASFSAIAAWVGSLETRVIQATGGLVRTPIQRIDSPPHRL